MKIFELKQMQQDLLDELFFNEDDELARTILHGIEGEVKNKLEYLADVLIECKSRALAAKYQEEIAAERLGNIRKKYEREEDRLRDFIKTTMVDFNIDKIKTDLCSISKSQRKSVAYAADFDVLKLPEQCIRYYEPVPDKMEIARHLKEGNNLPGCKLVDVYVVTVR